MAKDKKEKQAPAGEPARETAQAPETVGAQTPEAGEKAPETGEKAPETGEKAAEAELDTLRAALAAKEDQYLRLLAEYDNYRKRTTREKEAAWTQAKGDTVKALLPVYDNLERALKQETADESYRKGVEMIMAQLRKSLAELGVEEIAALGLPFDVNVHNAVMHVDDPQLGESVVKEVFQAGFRLGETVLRHAVVVVAN